jgi:hypothetical protein
VSSPTVAPAREFQLPILHDATRKGCWTLEARGGFPALMLPLQKQRLDSRWNDVSAGNMQAGDFMTKVYDACKKFQKV